LGDNERDGHQTEPAHRLEHPARPGPVSAETNGANEQERADDKTRGTRKGERACHEDRWSWIAQDEASKLQHGTGHKDPSKDKEDMGFALHRG
jgi:hypothetical protein